MNAKELEGRPLTIKEALPPHPIDVPLAKRLPIFVVTIMMAVLAGDSYGKIIFAHPAKQFSFLGHIQSRLNISDTAPRRFQNMAPDSQNEGLPGLVKYEILDGWLQLGLEEQVIVKKLGEPEKGEDILWGALGTYVQEWKFTDKGITLQMESEDQHGAEKIRSIAVFAPCHMQTLQKVGIGSAEEIILERYSKLIDKDNSTKGQTIVVGSIYGGTIFTIQDGKVSKIFIGAAAE